MVCDDLSKVDKLNPPAPQNKKPARAGFLFCGAGGIRTLVQTCDQICFLRAYFTVDFR